MFNIHPKCFKVIHIYFTEATSSVDKRLIDQAMGMARQMAPSEFAEVASDPQLQEEIARTILDFNALSREFLIGEKYDSRSVETKLAKHLPKRRIDQIKNSLQIPTIKLKIEMKNNLYYVERWSSGGEMSSPRPLKTKGDVNWAKSLQYASILTEGVMLFASIVDIGFNATNSEAIDNAVKALEKYAGQLPNTFITFVQNWQESDANICKKALALTQLIAECLKFSVSVIFDILRGLMETMTRREMIFALARFCVLFVSTEIPLLPMVCLAAADASDFYVKIKNVMKLSDIEKTL